MRCPRRRHQHLEPPPSRLDPFGETGIQRVQFPSQRRAAPGLPTTQADHLCVGAVQVDHVAVAGLGVQKVNVLGNDAGYHAVALQRGHRPVPGVGQGLVHVPPADVIARPIPLPEHRVRGELANRHRIARRRIGTAIVRDAGVGGKSGARQHRHAAAGQQSDQLGGFRTHGRHLSESTDTQAPRRAVQDRRSTPCHGTRTSFMVLLS
jgi:hypothetical protein